MEQSEHYKLGFELGEKADYNTYREKFSTPRGGSKEWMDFLRGRADKEGIIHTEKYKELNLDVFEQRLRDLCKEYSISLNLDSDDYGFRAYCGDFGFSIDIK